MSGTDPTKTCACTTKTIEDQPTVAGIDPTKTCNCAAKTNDDSVVEDKTCIVVALNLIDEWRFVGLRLGLKAPKLDELKKTYNPYGPCEAAYKMLQAWKRNEDEGATVKALASALREENRTDLATKITNMAGKGTTTGAAPANLPANLDQLKSQDLFTMIAKDFGIDWRFLGRYLGVKEAQLDTLEKQDTDIDDKAIRMLEYYEKGFPDKMKATNLVMQLQEMGRNDLVGKILKKAAK